MMFMKLLVVMFLVNICVPALTMFLGKDECVNAQLELQNVGASLSNSTTL